MASQIFSGAWPPDPACQCPLATLWDWHPTKLRTLSESSNPGILEFLRQSTSVNSPNIQNGNSLTHVLQTWEEQDSFPSFDGNCSMTFSNYKKSFGHFEEGQSNKNCSASSMMATFCSNRPVHPQNWSV